MKVIINSCRAFATAEGSKRTQAFEEIINKTKANKPVEPAPNEYVKLIKKMQELKVDEDRELTPEEVKDILRDIEIEASDEEYVEDLN